MAPLHAFSEKIVYANKITIYSYIYIIGNSIGLIRVFVATALFVSLVLKYYAKRFARTVRYLVLRASLSREYYRHAYKEKTPRFPCVPREEFDVFRNIRAMQFYAEYYSAHRIARRPTFLVLRNRRHVFETISGITNHVRCTQPYY